MHWLVRDHYDLESTAFTTLFHSSGAPYYFRIIFTPYESRIFRLLPPVRRINNTVASGCTQLFLFEIPSVLSQDLFRLKNDNEPPSAALGILSPRFIFNFYWFPLHHRVCLTGSFDPSQKSCVKTLYCFAVKCVINRSLFIHYPDCMHRLNCRRQRGSRVTAPDSSPGAPASNTTRVWSTASYKTPTTLCQ